MRGAQTVAESGLAGEETAIDQAAVDVTDDDAARVDSTAGDALSLDVTGADTAHKDEVNAALAILFSSHPEAVLCALDVYGFIMPMPNSVDLNGHDLVEGRSPLDMVIPGHKKAVLDTWEKARTTGVANAHVTLATDPERRVLLHVLDARAQHGVFISMFTTDEQAAVGADKIMIAPSPPAHTLRFARVRKDELAVLLKIDEAFTQILGWKPEEVIGLRMLDIIHPDDQELALDNWLDMLASPGPGRGVKLRHRHRDGSWVCMEVINHNLLEDPEHRCVIAEMVDISEEMATHEALRAREQLLDRLAETLPLGLLQVDSDARVIYTNDRLHSIVGTARSDTVEEQLSNVLDEDHQVLDEAFAGVLSKGIDSDIEVRIRPYGEREQGAALLHLELESPDRCLRRRQRGHRVPGGRHRERPRTRRAAGTGHLRRGDPLLQPRLDHGRARGDAHRRRHGPEAGCDLRRLRPLQGRERRAGAPSWGRIPAGGGRPAAPLRAGRGRGGPDRR